MAKKSAHHIAPHPTPFPPLTGRVAVLGGTDEEKTALLIGLALPHVQQQGSVLCVDARCSRATEVQFRLLLRKSNIYVRLPSPGNVPPAVAQTVLSIIGRSVEAPLPPLLLLDSVPSAPEWERTLSFLLKAGTTVVELLCSPTDLAFGRYDTVLLLGAEGQAAEALSRAVGRKVSAADLEQLPRGEAICITLAQVQRVLLPAGER